MAEPLLTLPEFEEYRTGDPQRLLSAATTEVRSYCGWHIAPVVTETVTIEGSGAALLLPTLHLTDVISITRDDVVIDVANIRWKPNGVVTGYAFGPGEYEVEFTHGYAQTPEDVARVVASLTADGIEGLRRVKSWTKGPFSESYEDGADADQAVLNRYRISARP